MKHIFGISLDETPEGCVGIVEDLTLGRRQEVAMPLVTDLETITPDIALRRVLACLGYIMARVAYPAPEPAPPPAP